MPFHTQTSATAPTSRLGGGGLDFITSSTFSAVSSVAVNNCFTNTSANYLLLVDLSATSADAVCGIKLRVSGTSSSTAYYGNTFGYNLASTLRNLAMNNATYFSLGETDTVNSDTFGAGITIIGPQLTRTTRLTVNATWPETTSNTVGAVGGGLHNVATAYDGFELIVSSGTFAGTVRVYGYRNA